MKNQELTDKIQDDECCIDEEWNNVASAKLPYSTKQFKNWIYSNKGKVYSYHLKYFCMVSERDNWESIFSSFDEKDFLYLSHNEIKRINVNFIDIINPKTTKFQKVKRNHQVTQKSISKIKNKSSREILKDMLI